MAVYRWKTGARASVPAQVAGEVCAALEAEGRLTQHDLVDVSRPEDAPLHSAFEWDDEVAAERYREVQAGAIIRSIELVVDGSTKPTKAFVSLAVTQTKREYRSIEGVLTDTHDRERLLSEARRELAMFRRKYKDLEELADIFAAMDRLVA